MRIISVLTVWILAASVAFSQDAPLPESVTTPYLAYEAAVEAGDEQAAAEAAEQAWRAGAEVGIDAATLGVLAENAGFYGYRAGRFEIAAEALLNAAELNRSASGDPMLLGRALRSASNAQLRLGHNRDAFSTAEDALEVLEGLPRTPEVEAEIALANATMSTSRWLRHHYRAAGRYGEQAVLAARRAGIAEASIFGVAAFQAGAYYSYEDEPLEAAYWFAVARATLDSEGGSGDLRMAASAWSSAERGELDQDELSVLLERLREDAVYKPDFEREMEDESFMPAPGRVDAIPVRRVPPDYPTDALWAGVEGFALMRFDVNEEGRTENVEVVYSIPYREFGEEGLRTVRRWRYEPATENGVPVVRRGIVTRLDYLLAD